MAGKFTSETARAALEGMGGSILFEKVLTSSDANGTGRLVIPKSQAEAHFPYLEQQQGMVLNLTDTEGQRHAFRFRFWVNNQSRMYLLENTAEVQQKYKMAAGDVLVFAKLPDGNYAVCGRKGTKDDVSRKPPVRKVVGPDGQPVDKAKRRRSGDTAKSKRMKQRQAAQAVQSMFSYWNGSSLPMRKDGVFRAVPNSAAAQDGDRVVAQMGAWSAIVSLGGELFQAFFETLEAANAALEAALQSSGKTEGATPPAPVDKAAAAGKGPAADKAPAPAGRRAAADKSQPAAGEGMPPPRAGSKEPAAAAKPAGKPASAQPKNGSPAAAAAPAAAKEGSAQPEQQQQPAQQRAVQKEAAEAESAAVLPVVA